MSSIIEDKVILDELTRFNPALTWHAGQLVVAWTGTNEKGNINLIPSSDGKTFGQKVTLVDTSIAGPALASDGKQLFMAWASTDFGAHISVMRLGEGLTTGPKVVLNETTTQSPAIAWHRNRLYLAWMGTDGSGQLHIMSSIDGQTFENEVMLNDTSIAGPNLTSDGNRLYLAWSGTDGAGHLNVMSSEDGVQFGNKVTLDELSAHRPALVYHGQQLHLAWTDTDEAGRLNVINSGDGVQFGGKSTFDDTGSAGPVFASDGSKLYISWSGTDVNHHLNVAQVVPSAPGVHCPETPRDVLPFMAQDHWENWHRNISRNLPVANPGTLCDLVEMVRFAEQMASTLPSGARIGLGVCGSRWSFSDCAMSGDVNIMVATDLLNKVLSEEDRQHPTGGIEYALAPDYKPKSSKLVHVEAGIKIFDLNCKLEELHLAMPTLGGSRGQSLAGVIGTGVHGGDVRLPPIADAVRAIHLVGPGGQQWWLEPASNRMTDPSRMDELRMRGYFSSSIKIVYDDDLFFACLVSMGCAGLIYSVVVEAVDAFNLESETTRMPWDDAKRYIQERIVDDIRLAPRFVEITLNPAYRDCRLTEHRETTKPLPAADPPATGGGIDLVKIMAILGVTGLGPAAVGAAGGLLGTLFAAVGHYIARVTAEVVALSAIPFIGPALAAQKMAESVKPVADTWDAMLNILNYGLTEEGGARSIPNLINLFWRVGMFVFEGRQFVNAFQEVLTDQTRPIRTPWVGRSFTVMTGQALGDCTPQTHPRSNKLIESREFAVPAEQVILFVDRLLAINDDMQRGGDAFVLPISLRFTGPTQALLGMQQFPKTCHVELYTLQGLRGNARFDEALNRLVSETNAVPHWGQFHSPAINFSRLFGPKLERWRAAMRRIANEGGGRPDLFVNAFARSRGLLT